MKIRVVRRDQDAGEITLFVDADEIGGTDGELVLFKQERCVAIFAAGEWISAELVHTANGGSLPS